LFSPADPMRKSLRYLRITWTVFCGIACVLLCVLWVRSYFIWDQGYKRLSPHCALWVWSGIGHFHIGFKNLSVASQYKMQHGGISKEARDYVDSLPWYLKVTSVGGFGIVTTYWPPTLLFGALAASPWIQRKWRFSLRTLLIATTLVALVLGLIVWLL
jgi:hypothetical protein